MTTTKMIENRKRMWLKIYLHAKSRGRVIEATKARRRYLHNMEYLENWKILERTGATNDRIR
jgi:hypothetical protein